MDKSGREGGESHTVSVRQFSGQGQRLSAFPQRLVWIAKKPEAYTIKMKGGHCWILSVHEGLRAPLLGVIQGHTVLAIGFRSRKLAKTEGNLSQPSVGPQQEGGAL